MSAVIIALVSLIITIPLFLSDGFMATYDIFYHVIWSEQFHKALLEGVLYPRWVDTPFGYGSPIFIFYAPISFYVISAIYFIINSHIMSIKIAIYLSFFLSGLSMYFFARKLNGERAGLVTAVIYQLIPYHVSELFLRGSIAALFAFIWFPLILLFIREIFMNKRPSSMACMSLAYASLILTHLVSSFMFTFVMIGYGLYLFFAEKKRGLLRMLSAMILGLALSSVYIIPVILEREFVHIEYIKLFNYKDNFLFAYESLTKEPLNRIAIIDALVLIISYIFMKRKLLETKNIFFIMLLAISLFLTIPLSSFVWKYTPGFSNLQFPWRWLLFSGLSVSIIGGVLIVNFRGKLRGVLIFILSLPLFLSFFIILKPFPLADIDFWREHSVAYSPFEYRPIWVKNPKMILPPTEKVQIKKGNGSIDIVDWKSNQRLLSTKGITPLILRFSTFYYPGWEARIDGKRCGIMIEKDSGSMVIEVPEGRHEIELSFKDTSVRYYGRVISIISLILVFSVYLYEILNPKNKSLRHGPV
jgi:uncharacterized membrane protein